MKSLTELTLLSVSTVTEIREAISRLNAQDRYLLMAELISAMPEPDENDPALLAALDEGIADDEADRVYTIKEVRAKISQWTSKSPSPSAP